MRKNVKETTSLYVQIGEKIRLLRKESRLSQGEVAQRLNVSFQQLQKYEKGINRIPISRLFEIALIFNKDISYFFNIDGELNYINVPYTNFVTMAESSKKDGKIDKDTLEIFTIIDEMEEKDKGILLNFLKSFVDKKEK